MKSTDNNVSMSDRDWFIENSPSQKRNALPLTTEMKIQILSAAMQAAQEAATRTTYSAKDAAEHVVNAVLDAAEIIQQRVGF